MLAELDRATGSLMDGIAIMERVHKRGVYIKVLDRSGLDLTTPSGRGILALLSAWPGRPREVFGKKHNAEDGAFLVTFRDGANGSRATYSFDGSENVTGFGLPARS